MHLFPGLKQITKIEKIMIEYCFKTKENDVSLYLKVLKIMIKSVDYSM